MKNVLEIEESKKLEQARIKADQAKAKYDDEIVERQITVSTNSTLSSR